MKFIGFVKFSAFLGAFLLSLFLILDFLFPLNLAGLNKEKSLVLYSSEGEILNMQISSDEIWRFYASSDEIPQRLKQSVVHFEDRYFYYHFGVNPFSIARAFTHNISQNFTHKNANIARVGASTITMQVARMMNPKERSYKNKFIEIFNAFQLEFHYTKDEILTMYFNLAPYGGNIEGVASASYFYFGKSLGELSNAQIALLAVVPKNPNKNRLDRANLDLNSLKNRLISSLYKAGILSLSEFERASSEKFTPTRHPAPNFAPHYAMRAFKNAKNLGVAGRAGASEAVGARVGETASKTAGVAEGVSETATETKRARASSVGAGSVEATSVVASQSAHLAQNGAIKPANTDNHAVRTGDTKRIAQNGAIWQNKAERIAQNGANLIHSNLNKTYQLTLENFLKSRINDLAKFGVKNGSAILIDNEKMAVVAYAGSHDFGGFLGQNDGIVWAKNVGSTLKPFIYARALEEGLITPRRELIDAPISFKNYSPRNYNLGFMGVISANDALGYSLNIPALKLLLSLGDDGLYELLLRANLAPYSKEHYGLGLGLGGISINLLNLTHLYSVFANSGELKPLELAGAKVGQSAQILSPQSAYIITQMLKNAPRSYLGSVWQNTKNMPTLMFKTGTSADGRDLYTIGVTPKFSLGVWFGNFNGEKTSDISGGLSAARVVFDMFSYLSNTGAINAEFARPSGVSEKEICADFFVEKECKKMVRDLVIEGVTLHDECEFYRPSELFYLLQNGIIDANTTKNGRCKDKFASIAPALSDIDGKIYEVGDSAEIKLSASCTAVFGDEIFISVNNSPYEAKKNGENFMLNLSSGEYELSCLDENANFSVAKFRVKNR
ncbi:MULTISPECIES: transglycosylase domain-containing protein [unclassified Campylobacter]|uniref:transglycosylase domain-containing protein n=1 Tax=unclassified Campylobacter TaxID=2593542 RepID=UPI0022E9E433|nr:MULTISPECIES: transglycosylase domain-containing protein [unclassified Campylobacter]MDA3061664.1 transglycosylase domain-containing protein [Campylobacter sp. JMF_14 EL1]MDA3073230.1 transglycosylase domain-containing protein [Campylobacter sp. JMF_10 EL2]